MESKIQRAEEARQALQAKVNPRWYPEFHLTAPAGWINDPNGICYFQGQYHVYYQHHPYDTQWGPMHWGHVTSKDLVTWQHQKIALAPSIEEDKDGVWSGSAVVGADGKMYAYYTGHRWRNGINQDNGNIQMQCLAVSKDGMTFEKEGAVVVGPEELPHFRDPKVWKQGDKWYMVFGACSADNRGEVWLYSSTDLRQWTFNCILFRDPNPDVYMIECPDLFFLDGKWVLIYCPMGVKKAGYAHRNGHNCGYVVGEWEEGGKFTALTEYRHIDWGHNFYAPHTIKAEDGRRLMFGWLGAFLTPIASQAEDGWSGQFSITRELSLDHNLHLKNAPIIETEQLRQKEIDFGAFELGVNEEKTLLDDFPTGEIVLEIDLTQSNAERIGLQVMATEDGAHTLVGYDDLAKTVFLDRRLSGNGDKGYRAAPCNAQGKLSLRVLVDKGSVEVFVNHGEESLSSLVFPNDGKRQLKLVSEAGSTVVSALKCYPFKRIWA